MPSRQKLASFREIISSASIAWDGRPYRISDQSLISFVDDETVLEIDEPTKSRLLPAALPPFKSEKRLQEFIRGRLIASGLIEVLSTPTSGISGAFPVGRDLRGRPVWPEGFQGSISHSKNHLIVMVSNSENEVLGVDLERVREVPENLGRRVSCSVKELEIGLSPLQLFSIKEAVYKSISRLVAETPLSFKQAEVFSLDRASGNFRIQLAKDLPEVISGQILFGLSFESRGFVCSLVSGSPL